MIQRLVLLLSSLLPFCYGLSCYHCGVFLSAPSPECRGAPKNISCDPDHYGCLKIVGDRSDGTYYVEKRCAEKNDDHTAGCKEITVQGIKAQQCFCEGDLCNSSRQSFFNVPFLVAVASFVLFAGRYELLHA
uniref:Protein sleepless n=1 Tax=Haemonchus contortus TaxID=6289 RepID=A0A7I5EDA4_HAECO